MTARELVDLAASVIFIGAFWFASKKFLGAEYGFKAFVLFALAATATMYWVRAFGVDLLWALDQP